jgi:hypothetical protein
MPFLKLFSNIKKQFAGTVMRRRESQLASMAIETLEPRLVLYAASGNAWPSPQLVTISFMPDGTDLGGVSSNLNSAFNGNADLNGRWQAEVLRAAQTWAQATNINLVVITDSGAASGAGPNQQGDPNMGDIRIGGYDFGNSSLAGAYMPPSVNNFSIAGDIVFNTAQSFGIGKNYDLFTVATHEFGHALGLGHTTDSSGDQMWATYNGVKPSLAPDDAAGIRSIYSAGAARSADRYDTGTGNNTFATATDITGDIVRTKQWAIEDGLDITTTSDVDYFKFTVPRWADADIAITAQSLGLSMLSQKITVYDSNMTTVLGTKTATTNGAQLWVPIYGTTANQVLYIKVEGAVSTAFGTGAYGLTLDLGGALFPTVTIPNTTLKNGTPLHSGGGVADSVDAFGSSAAAGINAPTLTIDSAKANSASVIGVAPMSTLVTVYVNGTAVGTTTAGLTGKWDFNLVGKLAPGANIVTATASDDFGNVSSQSEVQVLNLPLRRIRHAS